MSSPSQWVFVPHSLTVPDFDAYGHSLQEYELVTVRARASQGITEGEQFEKIPKEEAVCRFCFKMLQEDDNILKAKCQCRLTLMHQECENKSPIIKCGVCKLDVQIIPVTISIPGAENIKDHKQISPTSPSSKCCVIS